MKHDRLVKMLITAVLLAIGMILPFFVGQVQIFGQMISPMHIPALICGLTCGWAWGAGMGFVLPLLRSFTIGFPKFDTALPMAFELAVYGLVTGLLYVLLRRLLDKKVKTHLPAILLSMLAAMVLGRLAGGAVKAAMLGFGSYSFDVFLTAYFVNTAVGAVIHLIVVPAVVIALEKAKLSPMR